MEEEKNINTEQKKQDEQNNDINIEENPDDKEITEKEIKEIIDYMSTWTIEKYEKDHEIREALQLLKNKMIKDEKEKEIMMEELRKKENIAQATDINKEDVKEEQITFKEDEKITADNKINDNKNNEEVFKDNLDEDQKKLLEKTWNKSTKPEFGEKIINEKGDKEIIIPNDKDKKTKKKVCIYFFIFNYRSKQLATIVQLLNLY